MVKRVLITLFFITLVIVVLLSSHSDGGSYKEIVIGSPPDGAGDKIATAGGYKLIEFWHSSGGYWKATMNTDSGKKEIIISDEETNKQAWKDADILREKIYQSKFILEYNIPHPQEVINALSEGATITPVFNICKNTIYCAENNNITIDKFFNLEPVLEPNQTDLPKKPEYMIGSDCIVIRALPQLSCDRETFNQTVLFYPHKLPVVEASCGSHSYAMFHYDGTHTGIGYSPDPFYAGQGIKTIEYTDIKNLKGHLNPGFEVTTDIEPNWINEPSEKLKIGDGTFANAGAISIRFWYPIRVDYYASYPVTITPTPTPSLTPTPSPTPVPAVTPVTTENVTPHHTSSLEPDASCIIRADERGNEKFDVDKGIPVKENLFVNVRAKEYLVDHTFTEHNYSESMPIRVKATYQLTWQEDHGHYESSTCGAGTLRHGMGRYCADSNDDGIMDSCPGHTYYGCRDTNGDGIDDYCPGHDTWVSNWVDMSATEVAYSDAHMVNRSYSYWTVDQFEAFVPDRATITNAALPQGKTSLQASGISEPEITISHKVNTSDHVLNDPFSEAVTNNKIKYDTVAGCYVVDLGIKNLNNPTQRPTVPAITNQSTLTENAIGQYKTQNDSLKFNGKVILDNTPSANGNTPDPASIPDSPVCGENALYKNQLIIPDAALNGSHSTTGTITYQRLSQAVNPVHTASITEPVGNANSVTVHTPVVCNSGVRDDQDNDQTLHPDRTRSALVLGRPSRIRFLTTGAHLNIPGYAQNGVMDCRKYTRERQVRFPFDVYIGTDEPLKSCYVPKNTWYSIPMSASFDETDIFIPTWVSEGEYTVQFREIAVNAPNLTHTQAHANLNIENYVAVRESPVRVIGRLYGLKITDVTDQLWQEIFRVGKDTSEHTGNYYYTGTKNEEGQARGNLPIFTMPLLEGSHSVYKNKGALKTGYAFRFDLTTQGKYYGESDFITITPRFFYIKKDGTGRQEVDLWYHEDFNGKMNYFVKIESTGRNRDNPKSMILGDIYRNVAQREIIDTARILGLNQDSFEKASRSIGWLDQIVLSQCQRTFTGSKTWLPAAVNADTATQSVQKWYGEYYLPNDLFAASKGYDVTEYGRTHNGLNGKESFWLKGGYIIVNFQIETVQNNDFGNPVLSYWGSSCCNMLEREGFAYSKKDSNSITFSLQDGDIVFYDTDKRSSEDYQTGGTH